MEKMKLFIFLTHTIALCLATFALASALACAMLSVARTIRASTFGLVAGAACPLVALAFAFGFATLALTDALAVSMLSGASAVSVLADILVTHTYVGALR